MIKSRIGRYVDNCNATDASIPIGDFMWILEDEKDDKVKQIKINDFFNSKSINF